MGFFENILGVSSETPKERIDYALEQAALQDEVAYLGAELRNVQEDFLKISDAFDNVGWSPLSETESKDMPLATVKKVAQIARALNAANPFIKRGVNARISYIWGKNVQFDGVSTCKDQIDLNRKKLFTAQAFEEFERVLATDGNAFTALPINDTTGKATAFRISLDEITGVVANPDDKEEIWYYKREYTIKKTNGITGEVTSQNKIKFYANLDYYQKRDKALPKKWIKDPVEQNFVIQHVAVNRQVGWRWGVPDIMPVIFWAKAYKEYLEDNAMLVKAYSRLAWQIKSGTAAGGANIANQVMRPPERDPLTGELRSVGGTGISGLGSELSPIANNASTVDFSKGSPLASAIAAGLEVSLVVILSDSGASNRAAEGSLDLPTLKAMEARQNLHSERFLELFEFWGATVNTSAVNDIQEQKAESTGTGSDVALVTWPQIETDTTKDRVTAIGTAVELGILFKQEARKEVISLLGIAPYKPWDDLPTLEDDPAGQEQQQIAQDQADQAAQQAQDLAKTSVIAKQGVSGGVSAKGGSSSTANSSRTNRSKDTNNS